MAGCASCGTCSPWTCPKCGQEVCNWFEAEESQHKGCGGVRGSTTHPFRVVVTGSRDYANRAAIRRELEALAALGRPIRLAHGDCGLDAQRRFLWGRPDAEAVLGADKLAGAIGAELGFTVVPYPPLEWVAGNFVRSAGPRRNRAMLEAEQPDLVLAFAVDLAQSRGTRGCVELARRLGFRVRVVEW